MMYKPLTFFSIISCVPTIIGLAISIRFLIYYFSGTGGGHVQSLILACTLIVMGFLTFMIGLVADLMASNRRILQDTQYHTRKMEYDMCSIDKEI